MPAAWPCNRLRVSKLLVAMREQEDDLIPFTPCECELPGQAKPLVVLVGIDNLADGGGFRTFREICVLDPIEPCYGLDQACLTLGSFPETIMLFVHPRSVQ
jgi:hypothetical protein